MSQPRIFVSYSRKDTAFTQRLVSDLHAAGAEVWVDVDGIVSGNFVQAIDAALAKCEWMVLVLSPSAIESSYVTQETYTALHLVHQGFMRAVIPVLAAPCDERSIPPQWSALQRYDATRDYGAALGGLLRAVGLAPAAAGAAPTRLSVAATTPPAPPAVSPPAPAGDGGHPAAVSAPLAADGDRQRPGAGVAVPARPTGAKPRRLPRPSTTWSATLGGLSALVLVGAVVWVGSMRIGAGKSGGSLTPIPVGQLREFTLPTAGSTPTGIAAGPDGALWFTEAYGGRIGRITPAGQLREFPLPPFPKAGSVPWWIAAAPDGALWFTEFEGDRIGRITPGGQITEFPLRTAGSIPWGIAAGPDGALWFTEYNTNRIGRITPAGQLTEFPLPVESYRPWGIAAGPDGALWFTERAGDRIGRITPSGQIREFPIPTAGSDPEGIAAGPDGALWFTEQSGDRIGRITTGGQISEFPLPTSDSGPRAIVAGPDGALWFTEYDGDRIGRITSGR